MKMYKNKCSEKFFFKHEYKFTIENKNEQKKNIHQASKHLRVPGTNLKTINI